MWSGSRPFPFTPARVIRCNDLAHRLLCFRRSRRLVHRSLVQSARWPMSAMAIAPALNAAAPGDQRSDRYLCHSDVDLTRFSGPFRAFRGVAGRWLTRCFLARGKQGAKEHQAEGCWEEPACFW